MDEKNPAAAETEVWNRDKYFPVVRILTASSRSLIGVGGQILKSKTFKLALPLFDKEVKDLRSMKIQVTS